MQTFFSIQKSLGGYAIISSSYLNIIKCCLTLSVVRMDTSTCKISRWNFSRLLRKQQIILGISFFAAPSIAHWVRNTILGKQNTFSDHDETGAEVFVASVVVVVVVDGVATGVTGLKVALSTCPSFLFRLCRGMTSLSYRQPEAKNLQETQLSLTNRATH